MNLLNNLGSKMINGLSTFMSLISNVFFIKCLELRTVKRIRDAGLKAINDLNGTSNGKIKNGRFEKVERYILKPNLF